MPTGGALSAQGLGPRDSWEQLADRLRPLPSPQVKPAIFDLLLAVLRGAYLGMATAVQVSRGGGRAGPCGAQQVALSLFSWRSSTPPTSTSYTNSSEAAEGQDAVTGLPSPHLEAGPPHSVAETLHYRAFLCCS